MVSIIILNYNTWEDTLNEVENVHEVLNVPYKDIIVIDNQSTNDSKRYLEGKDFVFIESSENGGYAKGNNIGLRYSYDNGYKYSLILNNDIIIDDKNLLSKLKDVMLNNQSVAVVNPDIVSPKGYLYNRNSKRPSFLDLTFGMLLYKKIGRHIDLIDNYGYIYRPQGCCMLVDLEKMKKVDYFDEYTFLYNEELILAERLLQNDFKCACCVDTRVVHNHSKTINSNIKRKKVIELQQIGFKYYIEKYRKFNVIEGKFCLWFNNLKLNILK